MQERILVNCTAAEAMDIGHMLCEVGFSHGTSRADNDSFFSFYFAKTRGHHCAVVIYPGIKTFEGFGVYQDGVATSFKELKRMIQPNAD